MKMNAKANLYFGGYRDVLDHVTADLILTSPPYNIGSQAPAKTGTRSKKDGTYDSKSYRGIREYSDNLPEIDYQFQQVEFLKWGAQHLNDGGIIAYNHKPRRRAVRMVHPMEWISQVDELCLMEEIIWDRGSTHNHSNRMMWPHTERIYILRRTQDRYCLNNTKELDYRSDVWRIPKAKVSGHNAPFPEALARAVIRAWSPKGGTVVDPYSGSGTTAVAALATGRNFEGSEILPTYHQSALERINATTV